LTTLQRLGAVILLTVLSIAIHEFGHFAVYKFAGVPVRITLQSVRPLADVSPSVDFWAKLGGPAFSFLAAGLLLVAPHRANFFWATAALTNASLRLFPCVMDLIRAFKDAHPFSDEGDVALHMTTTPVGRALIILSFFVFALLFTALAARQFPFSGKRTLKVAAVYLLTLAVGIGVAITDELIHPKITNELIRPNKRTANSEAIASYRSMRHNVSLSVT
jgi:hypothetical protein